MKRPKITKKAVAKAIIGSSGLISNIAQRLDVSRVTVRNYLKKYPELEELIDTEKENILDFTESKLIKKINEEESWAIKYMLSTQGKNRGYGKEGLEVQHEYKKPSWIDESEMSDFNWFMRGVRS